MERRAAVRADQPGLLALAVSILALGGSAAFGRRRSVIWVTLVGNLGAALGRVIGGISSVVPWSRCLGAFLAATASGFPPGTSCMCSSLTSF